MMSLSRRNLLAGISSLVFSHPAKSTWSDPEASPRAKGGRINLGLNGLTCYMGFYALQNVWKQSDNIQIVRNGVSYWSHLPPGKPYSAWDNLLDGNGELVKPLPEGVTHLIRMIYGYGSDVAAEGYTRNQEIWCAKWDGTAHKVAIGLQVVRSARVGNRIEWIWGNQPLAPMSIIFSGIDRNDPPRNIRVCEVRHEASLEGGQLFNPDWVARVREGSGIIRFMDWQHTNNNICTLRFSDIPSENYCRYGGVTATPFVTNGLPLSVMSKLANTVQSHPWVCIPAAFGTRKLTAIDAITNSRPAKVTSSGHHWEDGDQVLVWGVSGMTQLNQNVYTVAKSDPAAGTLELVGVDSTRFGPFTGAGYLGSPYNFRNVLRDISLELEPFAAYFRDNMNPNLVTYFELSNETWNDLFSQSHWFHAQGKQLYGMNGFGNQMSGFIAAHCMKIIRETYGVENRNRWRGVLPTQTVNTNVTNRYLEGAKRYIREHTSRLELTDLFDDLAVTGYFGGSFENAHKSTVFRWMDLSERLWEIGLEPTKYSYFNRIVNEDIADGRHTGIPYSVKKLSGAWGAQKKIADANGLGLVQYEGGNGNNPEFSPALEAKERTRFIEFFRRCNHTKEDAANYTAMFDTFINIGGSYPSKFVEARPVSYVGAWGGLRHLADKNPVWDAVAKFNGRV